MTLQFGWYCTNCHIDCHIKSWSWWIVSINLTGACIVGTPIPSCFYPGPWLLLSHFVPIPCPTFIYCKVEEYCLKFAPSVLIYKFLHFSLNNILLSLYIYFLMGCWLEKPHPPLYFLRPQYLSFFFIPVRLISWIALLPEKNHPIWWKNETPFEASLQ